jgi:hypothetical protein
MYLLFIDQLLIYSPAPNRRAQPMGLINRKYLFTGPDLLPVPLESNPPA